MIRSWISSLSFSHRIRMSTLVLTTLLAAYPSSVSAQPMPHSVTLWGRTVFADNLLWVVDRSSTMGWGALDVAKAEITAAINQLQSTQQFNVIAFSGLHTAFADGVVGATAPNRAAAIAWLNSLSASGPTCASPAVLAAFDHLGVAGAQGSDSAILYAGDDRDNCWPDHSELQVVANNSKGFKIHAFGLGTSASLFPYMQGLAGLTGGSFTQVASAFAASRFRRGDVNEDSWVDVADVGAILGHLFGTGPAPGCLDAADVDDNNHLEVADAVFLVNYLFAHGHAPPAPGGQSCGPAQVGPLGICAQHLCP